MIVSKYIAKYLAERKIGYVFGVTGTAVNMCFVSLGEQEGIDYVCPMHEQGASMGADGYCRVSGITGVAIGTSGPGTSNMLTGCVGAYMDSIPIVYIVGQAGSGSSKKDTNVRFFGFQEMNSFDIFKPVTKYITNVTNPYLIKFELDKAFDIAESNRKGPCMLVVAEDVLYADIDLSQLISYEKHEKRIAFTNKKDVLECIEWLNNAKKPILLLGAGVHCANAEDEVYELAMRLGIPIALTFPARDLLDDSCELNIGAIGIFGSRGGNKSIQDADFILGIGVRLDRFVTGTPCAFAAEAKKILVDIDNEELNKYEAIGIQVDKAIHSDAKCFIIELLNALDTTGYVHQHDDFVKKCYEIRIANPLVETSYYGENTVNPYIFIQSLSRSLDERDTVFTDTGLSAVWVGQAFTFKRGQRWHTQFNNSSMGYALPAAIGASFANDNRIICITGDGGLQMSVQEFANVEYYKKNIKIFVICNDGYGLIQKTQDDYNNGHYATDRINHVPLPDVIKVAEAYGIDTIEINNNEEINEKIDCILSCTKPVVCIVRIPITKRISPRVKGGDLLNMYPLREGS